MSLTIEQSLVVDGHAHDPTYEPKVLQMMLVAEARVWVDLESVVITGGREGGRSHSELVKVVTSTYPAEYSKRP